VLGSAAAAWPLPGVAMRPRDKAGGKAAKTQRPKTLKGHARKETSVARLTRERDEALEQQTATAEVLRVINSSPGNLAPVFEAILEKAHGLGAVTYGSLQLYDGNEFRAVAVHGLSVAFAERLRQGYVPGPNHQSRRLMEGERFTQAPDIGEIDDPISRAAFAHSGIRTALFIPLRKEGRLIGQIVAARREVRPFNQKEIALLENFAAQAVIAMENARLFNETKESLQQQTATADVLKAISRSAFDLPSILTTLTESAKLLCGAASGIIFRREGDVYRYAASTMDVPHAYREHEKRVAIQADRGTLIGRVALERGVVHVPDAWTDPEYKEKNEARLGNVRAMLGVPLMLRGEPIGAFGLSRREPVPFTQRQVELVTTFADQAVIAIENARLFDEVQSRTKELSKSLDELRTAQDRLVQTEKLASLGQLTAGIAHEIKNPLNFVNNFSALSAELVGEMTDVLAEATLETKTRTELDELAQMLKSNLEKVVQHGKRADSIVKNMLLHSRQGSGELRSADINAIVDESLNLAYHGARAEKTGFTVTMQRNFDPAAGAADVYPQEITRVLLNLISNGFYATAKRKTDAGDDFKPTVTATTKNLGDEVEISIRDNGTGIPTEVKEKIFNPFFTTKPAGEGTGLGLSMSYDIIVKQHGGTIDVDTAPGAFTEFRIVLPRAGLSLAKSGVHK
jgi:two-component system NtrC family sensor kinase